jgi:ubiquinone/menaquinone biosynthesis C-methylase UbiE
MSPQNIYDNSEFYNGYTQLPRQVYGLDGAPEWPTIRALVPNLNSKRVVDLGCGFGWFSRWAREQRASSVLGVDLSSNMIEKARKETVDDAIEYRIEDMDQLQLPEASFDFAYSALAFHYVKDFQRIVGTVYNSLTPGSHFIFEIEHPMYLASKEPRCVDQEGGHTSYVFNNYTFEGERRRDWFVAGVLKYHRMLSTTLNSLIDAGFTIEHLHEYSPTEDDVAKDTTLDKTLHHTLWLIIKARR